MSTDLCLKKRKIYVVATGSGGHIIPAQSIVRQLKNDDSSKEIIWCTGNRLIENKLIYKADKEDVVRFNYLSVPGKKIWKYPYFFFLNLMLFFKSFFLFFRDRHESFLISTGGLLSIPLCFAAWTLGIPIVLVELNAVLGRTMKFLLPCATELRVVFEEAIPAQYQKKCRIIPYPLRQFSALLVDNEQKKKSKVSIAVFGGSQGSEELNHFFLEWLIKNKDKAAQLEIIHFYGNDRTIDFQKWYKEHGIKGTIESWTDEPELFYQKADFVISRAGSGALHELLFLGKKSFIYPLRKVADDHQFINAKAMVKKVPDLFSIIDKKKYAALQSFFEQLFISQ